MRSLDKYAILATIQRNVSTPRRGEGSVFLEGLCIPASSGVRIFREAAAILSRRQSLILYKGRQEDKLFLSERQIRSCERSRRAKGNLVEATEN
jgi:hypothetical protein